MINSACITWLILCITWASCDHELFHYSHPQITTDHIIAEEVVHPHQLPDEGLIILSTWLLLCVVQTQPLSQRKKTVTISTATEKKVSLCFNQFLFTMWNYPLIYHCVSVCLCAYVCLSVCLSVCVRACVRLCLSICVCVVCTIVVLLQQQLIIISVM